MKWRKLGVSVFGTAIAVSVAAAAGSSAAAASVKPSLADVREESPWALGSVAEMVQRGVFTGYEDGTFRPNQQMTRIEAVVTAVRQAGYEEAAKSDRYVTKRLKAEDAKLIGEQYAWAVGYVAVAEEKKLLPEAAAKALRPGDSAERWWTTALLLNAFGLREEAEELAGEELGFKDAEDIPEAGVGYAALAWEKGIVTGYEDGTFRPNASITRAEIAAMLDRIGDRLPLPGDSAFVQLAAEVSGTVSGQLILVKDGVSQPFPLAVDATIVREQQLMSLRGLVAGDEVTALIRRSDSTIVHVTVTETAKDRPQSEPIPSAGTGSGTGTETGSGTGTGTTAEPTAPATPANARMIGKVTAVNGDVVTITADDGTVHSYPIATDATIVVNQTAGSRSDIRVGDQVDAVMFEGSIFHVRVSAVRPVQGEMTGYITAFYPNQIEIGLDGRTTIYHVKTDAYIHRSGRDATLADLKLGDYVKVIMDNGIVWFLTVLEEAEEEADYFVFEGTYVSHMNDYTGKMYEITVKGELKGNPIHRTFTIDSDAVVIIDGKVDAPVYASRSTPVKLTIVQGSARFVEIGQ